MSVKIKTIRFGINRCYLIQDEGTIMIDGGPPGKSSVFQKYLENISIRPENIRLIVLTHGDFDHVGSAPAIRQLTGAKIAIHENDRPYFENSIYNFPTGVNLWGRALRFVLNPIVKYAFEFSGDKSDIVLDDSDYPLNDFGINGRIVFTPGHTRGSVSVLLDTGEAFVGCMAHNNLPFRFKPGLPIFAEDIQTVKNSWKTIIQQGANTIYPAHGDPFSVEVIKKHLQNN